MADHPTCAADGCDTVLERDQIEVFDVPVESTDEWVDTGESDEYGEIREWTGDWQTIEYGVCEACQERDQQLLEELEQL